MKGLCCMCRVREYYERFMLHVPGERTPPAMAEIIIKHIVKVGRCSHDIICRDGRPSSVPAFLNLAFAIRVPKILAFQGLCSCIQNFTSRSRTSTENVLHSEARSYSLGKFHTATPGPGRQTEGCNCVREEPAFLKCQKCENARTRIKGMSESIDKP